LCSIFFLLTLFEKAQFFLKFDFICLSLISPINLISVALELN
jgi:hypothetical protein